MPRLLLLVCLAALILLLGCATVAHAEECSQVRCPIGTTCVEEVKECLTTPCPQYSCKLTQGANPCTSGVCPSDMLCIPQPKQCVTTPCPQYACISPEEYICTTSACPASTRCVIEPKQCFTTPCPQYGCVEDPCVAATCPAGSVCLAEPKECFTTPCPQYACMEASQCPEVCPQTYAPVCGSDHITYSNECKLRMKMCAVKTSLYIQHSGACQNEPNDCPTACPALYSPVCGSDGVTYGNPCNLQVSACQTKTAIAVAYQGECADCNMACPMEYSPVCGTDGKTYGNECSLHSAACKTKTQISVKSKGECPATTEECPEFCPMTYEPLCGTDGNTYNNPCVLEVTACKAKTNIRVAHQGPCGSNCDMMCPQHYSPVCGTNRETYSNLCFLESAVCLESQTLAYMHNGECVGQTWKDFVKADTDYSDSVTLAEFAAGSGLPSGEVQKAFAGYDSNNDGLITSSDFLVRGNAQPKDSLTSSSLAIISVAACVAGLALVIGGYLYYRSKKHAQGFQSLAETRTNGLFEEEANEL